MNKKWHDISMIFLLGASPICFQYIKQNVESTNLMSKIQLDLDSMSQKQKNPFLQKHYNIKQLIDSKQQTKINPQIDLRIQTLKQWKSSCPEKYINEVSIITGLHTLGGWLLPSAFYLSILSYFILYQVNFVNDILILNGKIALFEKSKFSFQKINHLYMIIGTVGLGIAGVNKGMAALTKKISNNGFK